MNNFERVQKGAALLDKRVPGWAGRINQFTFDIDSFRLCVLGQLFGRYGDGIFELFGLGYSTEPEDHGFYPVESLTKSSAKEQDRIADRKERNSLWLSEINKRLEA